MIRFSFLFLVFSVLLHSQTFHSLDGIENQQGESVLLYRLGSSYHLYNPVYKFNTTTLSEQQVISAYDFGFISLAILDYEFFPGDEENFVHTGYEIKPDDHYFIARNDTPVVWDHGYFYQIDISKQDPLKVYAFSDIVLRSFDGGYTYPVDSILIPAGFKAFSISDFDDNIFFGIDEESRFVKNGAVVDSSFVFFDRYSKIMYDRDALHIYRLNKSYNFYTLNVSNNQGDVFTWSETFRSESPFYVTKDDSVSGRLYLAEENVIYKSDDFGYNFLPYRSLPYRINGLYKKAGSDILYASTPYKIFKITSDSAVVIKTLPLPTGAYDWFPMAVGNRWIYDIQGLDWNCWPDTSYTEHSVITKDTLIAGNTWFKFEPPLAQQYFYMRIDSAEGKIKALSYFLPDTVEFNIYDFYMEPGDSVFFTNTYPYDGFYLVNEDSILLFNSYREIRNLSSLWFTPPSYSLVKGIGFYSDAFCEFGGHRRFLRGCVIDGFVYGDTLTSADNLSGILPEDYILNQNYPNPFNPVTTISYSLPVEEKVLIIVFDALGRKISTLVDEEKPAGNYKVNFDAVSLSSGIYYYRMTAGEFRETRKMIILK